MSITPSISGRRTNVFDPFSLDVWEPFQGFPFDTSLFPSRSDFARETSQFANTQIDWKETPEAHVFKADLPGLKKEEVKVTVEEGRVLQISGERSKEKKEKNDKWYRVERTSGKYLRRFRLPENAKVEGVKTAMENGVLTVTVPKVQVKNGAVTVTVPKVQAKNGAVTVAVPKVQVKNRAVTVTVPKVQVKNGAVTVTVPKVQVKNGAVTVTVPKVQVKNGAVTVTVPKVQVKNGALTVTETKVQVKNGVLTVAVPKVQVKKPDVKSIEISG